MPKRVEFLQSKVKAVPVATASQKETQKEAADLAARKAEETYREAIREDVPVTVLEPAADTAVLTRSVSTSLGPPVDQWKKSADELAAKLDKAVARLDRRLDSFSQKQEENVGKKIEGSGLFSVPYVVWVGGIALFIFLVVVVLRVVTTVAGMSNPGVAVGTRIASLGANRLARGFSQVISAGEKFKDDVKEKFDGVQQQVILDLFRKHQQAAQDQDVQSAIHELTK